MHSSFAQSRDIIERHRRELREGDQAFRDEWGDCLADQVEKNDRGGHEETRYWAMLDDWIAQLGAAQANDAAQLTIVFDARIHSTPRTLALEALVYHCGLNGWRYSLVNPRLASSEETVNEDYDPQCRALSPLSELTVVLK